MSNLATRLTLTGSCIEIGIFSAVTNVLLLLMPLYMLQIYDRVLPASSISTLLYLSIFAALGLLVLGALDIIRGLYANRLASKLDKTLGSSAFLASLGGSRSGLGDIQPLRDLATIRTFIASRVLFFLFDLPFAPLFIILVYFIHPWLFYTTLIGAALMVAVAILNQLATGRMDKEAADALNGAMNSAQSFVRNAETVRALGMQINTTEFWGSRFAQSLEASQRVATANAYFSGIARTIRMGLQMVILGVGAYLVLEQQITAGMIFASSIISGRALQPLDQIVGAWRQIVEAKRAWKRLSAVSEMGADQTATNVAMPEPEGRLDAENVIYFLPNADAGAPPLIKRVTFAVAPGETVAMIGPSQAGKSTLARLIVGAITPRSGVIRLDGADIQNWDSEDIGRHVGYLPQDVELFPGTIAQNISRFSPDQDDAKIVEAAMHANVHDLILGQKNGYDTVIGPTGVRLSGGERQRIGLARAFYDRPKLVVLDEPNANLDAAGEAALERSILDAKARKVTVLLITHRPSIAQKCDKILMLRDGSVELYGPAAKVLERIQQGNVPATQQAGAPTIHRPGGHSNVTPMPSAPSGPGNVPPKPFVAPTAQPQPARAAEPQPEGKPEGSTTDRIVSAN